MKLHIFWIRKCWHTINLHIYMFKVIWKKKKKKKPPPPPKKNEAPTFGRYESYDAVCIIKDSIIGVGSYLWC